MVDRRDSTNKRGTGILVGGSFMAFRARQRIAAGKPLRPCDIEALSPVELPECEPTPVPLVYFIGAGDNGPIKIGIAASPPQRLASLQVGHWLKLSILATVDGGRPAERAYHNRFAAYRLHGEWFDRHPDILAEIDRLSRAQRQEQAA
jgi:hypothetical protein